MPTFREDLHLGHKVTLTDTDDICDRAITEPKLADGAVSERVLQDRSVTEPKLADNAVSTRTIQDGAVTPEKLSGRVLSEVIRPELADLQNEIDAIQEAGVAVSNRFGDNTHISISQRTLTQAFNRVWAKLAEITGEVTQGISMTVSPSYYIGEDGCSVHITANTVNTNGIFEELRLYVNGQLIGEAEGVDYYEADTEVYETSVIRCEASIMGVTYSEQKVITHYTSFFLGAGTSYTQVMNLAHVIPILNGMRGSYQVGCTQGDHIYVVVAESVREDFTRADMNGVEIQFDESTVTVDGSRYKVFTSQNTYQAGTYNIDING